MNHHLRSITELLKNRNAGQSTSDSFSLFPVKDEESFQFYKTQEAAVWSANEFDFVRDKADYVALHPAEKHLVDLILGFFAPADGLISQNLVFRFILECETYQEMSAFIAQLFIELVHAESYGMMIATLLPTEAERARVFGLCNEVPCVRAKTQWMERYLYCDAPRVERLAAFAMAEGLFFSSLFLIIFWFRSRGILKTLIFTNEQIAKDERLHRDFGCMLFRRYRGWLSNDEKALLDVTVDAMIREAVTIEKDFIETLLPEPIRDLNKEDLKVYATIVADHLMVELGYESLWKQELPENLIWARDAGLTQKSNFFEVGVGSYKQFNIKDALDWKRRIGWTVDEKEAIQHPESIEF